MDLVFATSNKGKLAEVKKLFEGTKFNIISLEGFGTIPDVKEDGETFSENAQKKAKEIYKFVKLPVLADDSGLEVDQLSGKPGVYSARYAGEHCSYDDNNKKLITELEGFPQPHTARFICCAIFYDGESFTESMATLEGEIIREKRGSNGFGYDPIFKPQGFDETLAELGMEVKNSISHRGKAFKTLAKLIINS